MFNTEAAVVCVVVDAIKNELGSKVASQVLLLMGSL